MSMQQIEIRPQPISIFPLPAGYLLLPDVPDVESVQIALLQGQLPTQWPDELQFYALALEGKLDQARMALSGQKSAIADYNRFVLHSDPDTYHELLAQYQTTASDLSILLNVVAYTLGYIEHVPAVEGLTGELRALVLMTQATYCLEREDHTQAAQLLSDAHEAAAETSPLLAAQLLSSQAELEHQTTGPHFRVIQKYEQAIDALAESALALTRAQLQLNMGICYQEIASGQRGALMEAVHCYQDALQVFKPQSQPEFFALAHNNLALAYLSMPMTEASDQLRMGIAVQSLREALNIYTKETHPELWASAQLNLANALQYLPSSHPEDNLTEAVELYEEILQLRSAQENPLGYARLLANQGNALAHLGIHDHAVAKLTQAHTLFTESQEVDAAASVQNVLAEIKQLYVTQQYTVRQYEDEKYGSA